MIIAVTGATGSIGRELVPYFKSLGHTVLIISTSLPSDGHQNFSYSNLAKNEIPYNVDIFIHLASINSNLEKDHVDSEVSITREILLSLSNLGCKKLIFFSTSKVYGDNSFSLNCFNETSNTNPQCFYGKAKKLCEELINDLAPTLDINAVIFRLPPVLNQSHSSNLGRLIQISKSGIPFFSIAQGDSNQRSFISFNNIKTVFDHLFNNLHLHKGIHILNLADDGFISLNKLIRIAGKNSVYSMPAFLGECCKKLPILSSILLKLYGNFVLENSKLKEKMNVKLKTTAESLPIIYK